MLNELETFTVLFTRLKNRVKNSPTTLVWLVEQSADVRRLAYLVGESAEKIRKNQAQKAEKHTIVPRGFITAWEEYEKRFATELEQIVEAERKAGTDDFLSVLKDIAKKQNEDIDSVLERLNSYIDAKRQPGDLFDPTEDDPALLVEDIFLTFEDVVDAGILSDDAADKSIGAWHFFENILALKHREIYNRWKKVPELLIPSRVLIVDPRPIIELYNEAVRTYVFGNKIASISMCRALLEHILEKHYHIDEKDLEKMITKAEGQFKQFRKLNMQRKRRLANRIMHDYEKQQEIEDQIVIDFLKTLQAIVKNIPK